MHQLALGVTSTAAKLSPIWGDQHLRKREMKLGTTGGIT